MRHRGAFPRPSDGNSALCFAEISHRQERNADAIGHNKGWSSTCWSGRRSVLSNINLLEHQGRHLDVIMKGVTLM